MVHGGIFSTDNVTLDEIRKIKRDSEPPDTGESSGVTTLSLPVYIVIRLVSGGGSVHSRVVGMLLKGVLSLYKLPLQLVAATVTVATNLIPRFLVCGLVFRA